MFHLVSQIFGPVATPPATGFQLVGNSGLTIFISRIIQLFYVIAGIYVLFQIIMAGYQYISANGDPKAIAGAWVRIWQSFMGLLIVACALLLTSIVSWFIFNDPGFILNPVIFTP